MSEPTPSASKLLALPTELQLRILDFLNPVDWVCTSLTNKHLYTLSLSARLRTPLTIGSPESSHPVLPKSGGCRHCVPVRWFPAHCELHYHLSSWLPTGWKYCINCKLFRKFWMVMDHESPILGSLKTVCARCGCDGKIGDGRRRRVEGIKPSSFDQVMTMERANSGQDVRWPKWFMGGSDPENVSQQT